MSRSVESPRGPARLLALLLVLFIVGGALAQLDLVVLRDGSEIECRVLELDASQVRIERADGARQTLARADVAAIEFAEETRPPLVVRVRAYVGDDLLRVFVNGIEVATPQELRGGWVDISELVHDGANELQGEVENEGGYWGYRWVVEAGGVRHAFQCGLPGKAGCTEGGHEPRAVGTLPGGHGWLYIDAATGRVEIQADSSADR